MQIPKWTKPALWGAGAGAIALAVVGFSWGGWVTGGTAAEMVSKQSQTAVAAALTPYCVQRSKVDPNAAQVLAEFANASSYQKRQAIEKSGWATPMGAEQPNRELASACSQALSEDS